MPISRARRSCSARRILAARDPMGGVDGVGGVGGVVAAESERPAHAATSAFWPVAARMIEASSASARDSSADQPALAEHQHPIGHAQHLGELRRDHQHGHALGHQLVEEAVDLGLGPDVDAAGRLVDDQHRRLAGQPLAEHDLLLVATRQCRDRVVQSDRT